MELEYLRKLRDDTIARHKKAEKTRGSGWHPADHGAEQRERDNELPLSERPIAFQMDDRIAVIGDCARLVKERLAAFAAKIREDQTEADAVGNGYKFQALTVRAAERATAMGDVLEMSTQDWNYCLAALACEGVQAVIVNA